MDEKITKEEMLEELKVMVEPGDGTCMLYCPEDGTPCPCKRYDRRVAILKKIYDIVYDDDYKEEDENEKEYNMEAKEKEAHE